MIMTMSVYFDGDEEFVAEPVIDVTPKTDELAERARLEMDREANEYFASKTTIITEW